MAVELFTSLTPIEPGHERDLRRTLALLPTGENSPLHEVPRTHVARWVVMEHLGMGDPALRRRLRPALLMFSAAVDGPIDTWLWELRKELGETADEIWSHCSRWPGIRNASAFSNWLLEHRIHHTLPFVAHPHATVTEIRHGLELRETLIEFTRATQDLDRLDLLDKWQKVFGPAEAVERQ